MVMLCHSCCERLKLKVYNDVVSECHRKFCWGCGWSSDSGLTSYQEEDVMKKLRNWTC